MKITPVHHAVLCYLEWHCDHRKPFRTVRRMARDLARNETEVQRAVRQLTAWGLISMRHDQRNQSFIVRLGDGRETAPYRAVRMAIPSTLSTVIHRRSRQTVRVNSWPDETRRAA